MGAGIAKGERDVSQILPNGAPFALYLRPFVLENWLRQPQRSFTLFFRDVVNFDFILQEHFRALGMLMISIGAVNDQEGAGHVVAADSAWRDRFRRLATHAYTIVVVPGIQPGIMFEIQWLRQTDLLRKVVFFKPAPYPEPYWRQTQEFYWKQEGIELPNYLPKQISFRLNAAGESHEVMTWETVYGSKAGQTGSAQMRDLLLNRDVNVE